MAKAGIGITIDDKRMKKALKSLEGGMQRRIVRPAAKKAFKSVVKAMKQNAPRETGTLKKSIGLREKTYKRRGVVWVGVGARKIYANITRGKRGRMRATTKKESAAGIGAKRWRGPTHYFHLVEYGTKRFKGKLFATRAFKAQSSTVRRVFVSEVRAGLKKLAAEAWRIAGRG